MISDASLLLFESQIASLTRFLFRALSDGVLATLFQRGSGREPFRCFSDIRIGVSSTPTRKVRGESKFQHFVNLQQTLKLLVIVMLQKFLSAAEYSLTATDKG
jgi:hypothetical protein